MIFALKRRVPAESIKIEHLKKPAGDSSGKNVTPAMQAGLTKRLMSIEDIANLVPVEAPQKRGTYKKEKI